MKKNLLMLALGVAFALVVGAGQWSQNPRFNRLVRDADGRLMIVDMTEGKAVYVRRENTVPSLIVEVDKTGWQGEVVAEPQLR